MSTTAQEQSVTPRWLVPSFFVTACALYAGAIGDDYVLDGALVVGGNPLLERFEPLRIATQDWWAGSGKPGGLFRPVTLVSLAALKHLGGVAAIDCANVVLHGAVAWARFELLKRLLGAGRASTLTAWLAALLALVSPLAIEVVAGQVGTADLLATLLATCALLAATRASIAGAVLGAALACAAMLSKESAIAVVPMAMLFEALRVDGSLRGRRVARAFAWSGVGVAAALACRYAAIGSLASVDDPVYAGFSNAARIASALAALASYTLPLLVAPWRQLAVVGHHDVAPTGSFGDARVLAGALALLVLAVAPLLALRRGHRDLAFGAWLFLVAWLPTSNLLVSSGALAASRFLYFGLVGFTLLLARASVAAWSRGSLGRTAAVALVAWFGVFFAARTWREVPAWSSQRAIAELQVARAPNSAYGLVDLASELRAVEPPRAEELFRRAAELPLPRVPARTQAPEDALESAFSARIGRASLAAARGDSLTAQGDFELAAQLAARGIEANSAWPQRENWNVHRGFALRQVARLALDQARTDGAHRAALLDRAARCLNESDASDDGAVEGVELRAHLLHLRGDFAQRRAWVEHSLAARPNDPTLRALWAAELRQARRDGEALEIELELALEQFERADLARSLAIGKEALASPDATIVARGRRLLGLLVGRADAPAGVAVEAARALAGQQ